MCVYTVCAESEANVQEFLNAIHKDFVSTVDPLESGLQDRLIQCGLLTNTDHESLKGGHYPTREEKARLVCYPVRPSMRNFIYNFSFFFSKYFFYETDIL